LEAAQLEYIIDIAMVMLVVGLASLILPRLRYPPVIGYLLGGVIIGAFALVSNPDSVSFFADLGIIMLMFFLGLEFNLNRLRRIGMFALVAGTIEIVIMMAIGYSLGLLLGWGSFESIFLGAVMSISSTALITKTLMDMGRLTREYGEAIVGLLIVEDFFVIIILTLVSPLTTTFTMDPWMVLEIVLRVLLFISISISLGLMVLPRAMDGLCGRFSEETVVMVSLGLCFLMVMVSLAMELSVAIGAFMMGIIISRSRSVDFIVNRIRPVTTLFIAIFFVSMGMLIRPELLIESALTGVIIAAIFMLGNTFAVGFATYVANRSAETSVMAGLGMMAMGEFSIIISKVGVDNGLLSPSFYSTILTTALITMILYPLFTYRADGIVTWIKRRVPARLRESLIAIEEIRAGVRDRMSQSSMRSRQQRREISMIFVEVVIVIVIILGANLILALREHIGPIAEVNETFLSLLVLISSTILLLPPLVSIIRRLNFIIMLFTLCTEESGVCKLTDRRTVRNILVELNSVFVGVILLFLILPLIPVYDVMPWPFVLLAVVMAMVVAYLLRKMMRSAHQRFAQAIINGMRDSEEK